uniref:7TM_GPCR_Srx domain-containing protein n=1 Tax=Elaeophora elaphi TaxID=1147741 RepID=A0A0R3RMT6_9BILA
MRTAENNAKLIKGKVLGIAKILSCMDNILTYCYVRYVHCNILQYPTLFAKEETNAIKTSNYEWSALIQAALTCISMEIEMIIFNFSSTIAVEIFGEKADIPSRILINCSIISNCAVLPTIYFIYNKRARNIVKQQFLRLFLKDRAAKT